MPERIFKTVINLGNIDPEDAEALSEQLDVALVDVLDECGVSYRVETFGIDVVSRSTAPVPDENSMGPFTSDSETSRKAAHDNYPRSGTQRWNVLLAIASRGSVGCTRDELAEGLGLPDSGTDARVWELKRGDFIEESEKTRTTQHGSEASVLVLTDKGKRYVEAKEGHQALGD